MFKTDNNKIVEGVGNGGANRIKEILAKFKNIKKSVKTRHLE